MRVITTQRECLRLLKKRGMKLRVPLRDKRSPFLHNSKYGTRSVECIANIREKVFEALREKGKIELIVQVRDGHWYDDYELW